METGSEEDWSGGLGEWVHTRDLTVNGVRHFLLWYTPEVRYVVNRRQATHLATYLPTLGWLGTCTTHSLVLGKELLQ